MVDPGGAVFVGARVAISSELSRCEATSDTRGEFNCALPPGIYAVNVEKSLCVPFRGAPIQVPSDGHKFLVVRMLPLSPSGVVNVKHSLLQLPGGGVVVLRYESEIRQASLRVFRGGGTDAVSLSVDDLTVIADRVSCTDDGGHCEASGKVIVDSGWNEATGFRALVDLKGRSVTLTRTPTISFVFGAAKKE